MVEGPKQIMPEVKKGSAALMASAAFMMSACGLQKNEEEPLQLEPVAYETAAAESNPKLIFTDLRSGRHTVQVFESPFTTKRDRKVSEYFYDGDRVEVRCKEIGRRVISNTWIGERKRTSKQWFQILTTSRKKWASAVYVKNLRELRANPQITDC